MVVVVVLVRRFSGSLANLKLEPRPEPTPETESEAELNFECPRNSEMQQQVAAEVATTTATSGCRRFVCLPSLFSSLFNS